jgi:non-lysosomal glucosylceramidase
MSIIDNLNCIARDFQPLIIDYRLNHLRMKYIFCITLAVISVTVDAQTNWPVLKHYDGNNIGKIAMPVGGIGTGTISFGGNGQWKDVEIMNRPAKGFYGAANPKEAPCFLIYTEDQRGVKKSKALMGPISISEYAGAEGSMAPNHGLPRFAKASADIAYPFMTVNLDDDDMPVSVKQMQAEFP